MSETETHIGRLIKVDVPNDNETYAYTVCTERKWNPQGSETYLDCMLDRGYEEFKLWNNTLYQVVDHEELDEGYLFHTKGNEDGSINFVLQFYNGGTCLSEMLDDVLEKNIK